MGVVDCNQASGFCFDYNVPKDAKLYIKLFDERADTKGDFMADSLSQDWR